MKLKQSERRALKLIHSTGGSIVKGDWRRTNCEVRNDNAVGVYAIITESTFTSLLNNGLISLVGSVYRITTKGIEGSIKGFIE